VDYKGVWCGIPRMHSALAKTQPLDNLAPLAKANVPLLHVCGSLDPWFKDNTLEVEKQLLRNVQVVQDGKMSPSEEPGVGISDSRRRRRKPCQEFR